MTRAELSLTECPDGIFDECVPCHGVWLYDGANEYLQARKYMDRYVKPIYAGASEFPVNLIGGSL